MNSPVAPLDDVETGLAMSPAAAPPWGFLATLPAALDATTDPVAAFRQALADGDASLKLRFADDEAVEALVRDRARMVDVVLRSAWQLHVGVHVRGRQPASRSAATVAASCTRARTSTS